MIKPKLFLSYSHKDKESVDRIREFLLPHGYLIFSDHNIKVGEDYSTALFEQMREADYFLLFITEDYLKSRYAISELNRILGYTQNTSSKSAIPILLKETELTATDLSKYIYLNCVGDDAKTASSKIVQAVEQVQGKKEAEKEKIAERVEKINISIVDHIEPILKDLKEREDKLRRRANTWNYLGYIAIILGILAAVTLVVIDVQFHLDIDWQRIMYLAIKGAILLILLLSSSKYAFTLSKSYMNESLKNADRIHAISFGKFYIKVFEQSISPNDFKEIFQNWNLSKDSSFSSLSTDSYDPKLTESISKILDTVKDMAKK
jgi:TIR domain